MSEQTGTQIEITTSRDGSVTVMVSGKHSAVNEAKVKLQKELQTNVCLTPVRTQNPITCSCLTPVSTLLLARL